MKAEDLDKLERRAEDQATETRVTTARATEVLRKFRLTNQQKKQLLETYAAQDAATKKKAAKGNGA